jgi:hypothetical protein
MLRRKMQEPAQTSSRLVEEAGVPGAKVPGEGDLPVVDGSLGRGRELEQDCWGTVL